MEFGVWNSQMTWSVSGMIAHGTSWVGTCCSPNSKERYLPLMSAAIVVNNGLMITHISKVYSVKITWESVVQSLGVAGALNAWGRLFFIEAAKAISWGTGNP